jgi:hypothetical protein
VAQNSTFEAEEGKVSGEVRLLSSREILGVLRIPQPFLLLTERVSIARSVTRAMLQGRSGKFKAKETYLHPSIACYSFC